MGRISNDPRQKMKHFSHHHELELWNWQSQQGITNSSTLLCSCCKLPQSENMYICRACNFILHLSCAKFPEFITHPAHRNHNLTLLPMAAYPGGVFNCDACNLQGNGFSYHCSSCEYDLHVICASKPLKFIHQSHSCPLELTFTNPYNDTKGFSCDVCHKFGSKQWLYRCNACEFDVHLDCTTASPARTVVHSGQGQLLQHHHNSFPGENIPYQVGSGQSHHILQHHQFMHSASMGASANPMLAHNQFQPNPTVAMAAGPVMHGTVVRPNVLMHSASTGQIQNFQLQQPNRTSGLMNSVIQGLVGGAAQQVGQTLVQGMFGGGGGGGGDGSSILGGLLGDSSETQN